MIWAAAESWPYFEESAATRWVEIGHVEQEYFCAFADPANLDEPAGWRAGQLKGDGVLWQQDVLDLHAYGIPLIGCETPSSVPLAVEIAGHDEFPNAVRLAFDDIDFLSGTWFKVGELDLAAGRCIAIDPPGYGKTMEFFVEPGVYDAEAFKHTDDVGLTQLLGLRLRA